MDGECLCPSGYEPPGTGSRRVFRIPPEADAASVGVAALKCLLLASVAMLALAGCGFHLQGAVRLPEGVRSVYVATSDELTPFAVALKQSLERSGASIAGSAATADTVLRVTKDRTGRRVLSVSSRNTPQEYEVFYTVEYSIDRAGKEVVSMQPLELTRNFSFDESRLLAKDREEEVLRDAMAQDLATLVVRRIESP
jgi:LPS-assembly lipoprotein